MKKRILIIVFLLITAVAHSKSLDSLCKKKNAIACKDFGMRTKIPLYLQKACDLNLGSGCMELGLRNFKEKKVEEGEIAFKKGCKLNDGDSCSYLGAIYS